MKKRILAILLTLCMVVTLLPTAVFAEEDDANDKASAWFWADGKDLLYTEGTSIVHTWDEGTVTTEPTCAEMGVKTYTCTECGEIKTEGIAKLGHELKKTEAKVATATQSGNKEYYTCTRCGKYFSDENGTVEIEKDSWVLDPATVDVSAPTTKPAEPELPETATATEKEVADNANDSLNKIEIAVPKDPEAGADAPANNAILEKAEEIAKETSVSDEDMAKAAEKLSDEDKTVTAKDLAVVVQPYLDVTITDVKVEADTGERTMTIDVSPKYNTVVTSAATVDEIKEENSVVIEEAQPLKIDKPVEVTIPVPVSFFGSEVPEKINVKHTKDDGTTYIYEAKVTNKDNTTVNVTFTNPHGFSKFEIGVEAASINIDTVGYETLQAAVDAAEDDEINIAASVTEKLVAKVSEAKTFTVKYNGTGKVTITAAEGLCLTEKNNKYTVREHDWNSGGITKQPTCKDTGIKTYVCNVCSETKTEVVDKLTTHTWNSGKITVDPTFDNEGVKTYTCTVCGETKEEAVEKRTCDHGTDCPLNKFTDLEANLEDGWSHNGIHFCLETEIMNGLPGNKFDPNGTTTRAMIVKMLYFLEDQPSVNLSEMTFKDVPAKEWYAKAVAWASENKIVEGYGNGKFGPEDPITREQLATILYRYADYKGYDISATGTLSQYTDSEKISEWALPAMKWVNNTEPKIIKGDSDTTLDPASFATRAQTAAMFQRFCEATA